MTTSALRSSPVINAASAKAASRLFLRPMVWAAYSPTMTFGPLRS